jgi:transcriptional regulator with XRE-family HTH domain
MPQIEATPLREHWGKRIRAARQQRGLSLNRLARLLEIDAGNLSRIERGRQRMTDERRVLIARGLGTTVDELFDHPDDLAEGEQHERVG